MQRGLSVRDMYMIYGQEVVSADLFYDGGNANAHDETRDDGYRVKWYLRHSVAQCGVASDRRDNNNSRVPQFKQAK